MSVYSVLKRSIDLLVSGTLIVALVPFWIVIAVLVKLDSRGPIFFVQPAVGLHGRRFQLFKFRSMRPGSQDSTHRADVARNLTLKTPTTYDPQGRPVFKTAMVDSSRITRVGRILRRTSLDEVPQLWNVFMGHMSLVGPRPSLPWEAQLYEGWERERLLAKPGMTGLYQVTARNRVPIEEMIRIDIDYVRRRSFWFDVKVLFRTPAAMFNGM